ncbi:MAG: NAD-dependent epimerase/dehydratase family protein [Butyrivibrio sp.]|nr:NAD-dependent epimerase/dehydratase family protein [Butyrivibrio sp.]
MKILVVGGTRFFGIPMVNALLSAGHDVTIATRGNAKADFAGEVHSVVFDRTDPESVKRALGGLKFDVIIDKIAYGSNDVKALLVNVSCDRYIQMSSCSVYHEDHADIREDEFITKDHPLKWQDRLPDYPETKRNAERAALEFMDEASCTFVRYPVVLGENDYTGRLRFYVDHIRNESPMYVDDMDRAMSFIHEKEAGQFIAYLADHPCSGAVNGCSNGVVKISEIIHYAEKKLGKTAILDADGDAAPYNGLTDTLSFNTEKANGIGYTFSDLGSWIYGLIDHYVDGYRKIQR